MKWNKYRLKTTTDAVDFVSGILMDVGITNIEIEDNVQISESEKRAVFADILPQLPPDEGIAYINFYVDIEDGEIDSSLLNDGIRIGKNNLIYDEENLIKQVSEGLDEIKGFVDIGEGTITKEVTEDADWINNWKQYFKPFEVDNILIKPTWEEASCTNDYKMVIDIDPGTAFGTGMHQTTQLCIHQIDKFVSSDTKLLDIGCGSGILSIIALKLGIAYAVATDIDENAVCVAKENALMNGVDFNRYQLYYGNIINDKQLQGKVGFECYDIVVANILADVIIPIAQIVPNHLKKGGVFISSGILKAKESEVIVAIKAVPRLELMEVTHQGDWVSITAKCKE